VCAPASLRLEAWQKKEEIIPFEGNSTIEK
jgi:hypothetical protein